MTRSPEDETERGQPSPLILRLTDGLMSLANVAATAWILLLMALIIADVLGRNLFRAPIAGVPEMVSYSILGIVFLQVAHTHRNGEMIRSDGLLTLLTRGRPRVGAALDLVAQIAGVALALVLARAVWPKAVRAFERGEMEGVAGHFQMPVWPFLTIIAGGSILLALSFAVSAFGAARKLWTH